MPSVTAGGTSLRLRTPDSVGRPLGTVLIGGVGFRDFAHGQTGAAPNYVELHPVTGLRIISGC
jgi:hypothetical protein